MLLNVHKDKHVRVFVEKKLLVRLRIFFFIIFVLIDAIILEISLGNIQPLICIGAVLAGMLSGVIFVRRKKIYWEEETNRVIARMDRLGIILLALYIIFAIFRHWLLSHWFHGIQLTAFGLSFATGGMISRVWIIRRQIRRQLKKQNII
jgi:hypothetical protein